jgi:hypothetical protein
MAERFSIYAGPPMIDAIKDLGSHYGENRSGRLNTVCERYRAMVADELARIDLSKNEWCAIMDANNGVEQYIGGAAQFPSMPQWATGLQPRRPTLAGIRCIRHRAQGGDPGNPPPGSVARLQGG